MKLRHVIVAGILAAAAFATSASAQSLVSTIGADRMAGYLRQKGLTVVEITASQSNGNPIINAKMGNTIFQVLFYSCDTAVVRSCSRIQFRGDYETPTAPMDKLNKYNNDWVFGKAYMYDATHSSIEYPVALDFGISEQNLLNSIDLWTDILTKFEAQVING